jgi:KaiC/GvpD/RAD55 family RecA-like ATPase
VDANGSDALIKELTRLKQKWSVYSHGDLKQRYNELGGQRFLIEGLLPDRSLGILVGDSGLGKSPLVYQMAACVASGTPFLGRKVRQARVLCLDFENGLGQVDEILTSLNSHLGIEETPRNLLLWNFNDSSSSYGQHGHKALDIIQETKPELVIVDSLTGLFPNIEDKNSYATECYQSLRKVMKDVGTSILTLHHIKKPSEDSRYAPPRLENDSNPRDWFLQARGARALINGADIRIAVEAPYAANTLRGINSNKEEIALVMRGFGRVKGEIALTYLARVRDENGDPIGYRVETGASLLFHNEQEAAFAKLSQEFRFKDAQQAYGKGAQATTDFLNKCMGLGLIRKIGRAYEKLKVAE